MFGRHLRGVAGVRDGDFVGVDVVTSVDKRVVAVDTGPVVDGKYSFKLNARFDDDWDIDVRGFFKAHQGDTR